MSSLFPEAEDLDDAVPTLPWPTPQELAARSERRDERRLVPLGDRPTAIEEPAPAFAPSPETLAGDEGGGLHRRARPAELAKFGLLLGLPPDGLEKGKIGL